MIMQLIHGFCMALADSVPGVSGGTIAFLMGFYDDFITSIDDLLTGNMEKKKKAFTFLVKIGIGWVIGFLSAVLVLTRVFESHIYAISSLFIGFIIFAIPVVIGEEKKCLSEKKKWMIFTVLGAALVAAITYFNPVSGGEGGMSFADFNAGFGVYLFAAGAIAISAMVLPGMFPPHIPLCWQIMTCFLAVSNISSIFFLSPKMYLISLYGQQFPKSRRCPKMSNICRKKSMDKLLFI